MAKALVLVSSLHPSVSGKITAQYTVATDTGLVLNGITDIDFSQTVVVNITNIKNAAITTVSAFPGSPSLAITDVLILNTPS